MITNSVIRLIDFADSIRVSSLSFFLRSNSLRKKFRNKSERVFGLFLLCNLIYLPLSLIFPLVILLLGPIIYGIPHLFASLRYVPESIKSNVINEKNNRKIAVYFLTTMFFLISGYRLYTDVFNTGISTTLYWAPEVFCAFVTFIACFFIFKGSILRLIISSLILGGLVSAFWYMPLWTSGFLIIFHNFVAFFYWISHTKNSQERKMACYSLGIFALVHILVIAGTLDFIYKFVSPSYFLSFAELDFSVIGKIIAPWSEDFRLHYHLVVVYAYGQALHYFVWMKAIPDHHHTNNVPTSFRQSFKLFCENYGITYTKIVILFVLITWILWTILKIPEARVIYFAIASFHGFMEIAGLGLLKIQKL